MPSSDAAAADALIEGAQSWERSFSIHSNLKPTVGNGAVVKIFTLNIETTARQEPSGRFPSIPRHTPVVICWFVVATEQLGSLSYHFDTKRLSR